MHEPGKDTAKFDTLAPIIVKPVTREAYSGEHEIGVRISRVLELDEMKSYRSIHVSSVDFDVQ